MNREDIFTIIILVYNNQQYIKECIDSVLEQNYEYIEIIISDDASQEFSRKGIEEYINENKKNNIINIIINENEQNLGTVKSINNGIKLATGNYFMTLACDDKLHDKNILKDIVDEFKRSNHMAIIGRIEILDATLENLIEVYPYPPIIEFFRKNEPIDIYKRLCEANCLPGPGFSYTRDLINMYGLYDEDYKLVEDYPRYVYLSRMGCRIWFMDRITVKHRYGVGVYSKAMNQRDNEIGNQYKKDKLLSRIKEIEPYIDKI